MALDPVLQALIDQLPKVPPGPVDYPSLRKEAASMLPLLIGPDGPAVVRSMEEREIDNGGIAVPLRIYRPESDPVGTIHYVHGGGWSMGELATVDHTARRLCRDLSMVVVTSSYRLAPENPFPAPFEDSLAAASWVVANLSTLGGAHRPAVIAGDSAGGNLVAAICIEMRDAAAPAFDAQLLLYPAVDLRPEADAYPSRRRDADPTLRHASLQTCVDDYAAAASTSDPRLSPMAANDLAGLPPALIVVLTVDPLRDEAVAYADRLRDAGGTAELIEFGNLTHGFVHLAEIVPAAAEATGVVLARLAAMLGSAHKN
jgi:acetyl esterase